MEKSMTIWLSVKGDYLVRETRVDEENRLIEELDSDGITMTPLKTSIVTFE